MTGPDPAKYVLAARKRKQQEEIERKVALQRSYLESRGTWWSRHTWRDPITRNLAIAGLCLIGIAAASGIGIIYIAGGWCLILAGAGQTK